MVYLSTHVYNFVDKCIFLMNFLCIFSNVILYILRYALIKRHISVSTTEMTIASQFDSAKIYICLFSLFYLLFLFK